MAQPKAQSPPPSPPPSRGRVRVGGGNIRLSKTRTLPLRKIPENHIRLHLFKEVEVVPADREKLRPVLQF